MNLLIAVMILINKHASKKAYINLIRTSIEIRTEARQTPIIHYSPT